MSCLSAAEKRGLTDGEGNPTVAAMVFRLSYEIVPSHQGLGTGATHVCV